MEKVHGRQVNALYRMKSTKRNKMILRGVMETSDKCAYGDKAIELQFYDDDRGYEYFALIDPEFLREYLNWFDSL